MKKSISFYMITIALILGVYLVMQIFDFSNQYRILYHQKKQLCKPVRPIMHEDFNKSAEIFSQSYNQQVPLIWNRHLTVLKENVESWWVGIYRKATEIDYIYLSKVFDVLESFGYPTTDTLAGKTDYTCAVVGNSDALIGGNHGKVIDMHNVVIRFNRAVTQGYEKDVGSKTSFKFFYPESYRVVDYGLQDYTLLLSPFKLIDIDWVPWCFTNTSILGDEILGSHKDRRLSEFDLNHTLILHPEFMHYVHHKWLKIESKVPSLGMIGLVFALHQCEEVSVFGFGANRNGMWAHYFDQLTVATNKTNHNGDIEKKLLLDLHSQHVIKYFSHLTEPWWP